MKVSQHLSIFKRAVRMVYDMDKAYMISLILLALLRGVRPFVPIYFSAKVIDSLFLGSRLNTIIMYVVLTVGISFLFGLVINYVSALNHFQTDVMYRNESAMFSWKAMGMAYESIEDREVALLRERVRKETQTGYNRFHLHYNTEKLIHALTQLVTSLSLTMSFFTMKSIPLYMKLLLILLMGLAIAYNMTATAKNRKYQEEFGEKSVYANIFGEKFGGYVADYAAGKDIRIYGMQDALAKKWLENEVEYLNNVKVMYVKTMSKDFIRICLNDTLKFAVYAVLIYAAINADMPVGSIAKNVSCITMMLGAVDAILFNVQMLMVNNTFMKRYFAYLDIPNNMYQGSLTVEKRDDNEYYVEFKDVSFKYPNTEEYALKSVNLKFKVGEKLAVVGMNGSGKTTFIKLMCRLYDPTEGEILLNDVNIKKYDYDEYMSIFSVVFQDFGLFDFSLGQNVAAAKDYDKERVLECLRKANFGERMENMPNGTDTPLYKGFDKEGIEISGGEAQKIALARALYKDAPFIILDEPTAALDPVAEYEVYSNFNKIAGDKTAIYISHRLASCKFCDKIAVFDKGSIVQVGAHEKLVENESGKYYELWNAQAQYYA